MLSKSVKNIFSISNAEPKPRKGLAHLKLMVVGGFVFVYYLVISVPFRLKNHIAEQNLEVRVANTSEVLESSNEKVLKFRVAGHLTRLFRFLIAKTKEN